MKIPITFRCGHTVRLDADAPIVRCACGEAVVVRAAAPAPRLSGAVRGPGAKTNLQAEAVSVSLVAPEHALKLKPIEKES